MIILKPFQTFRDLLWYDIKEDKLGWLKFLFVETYIGWILSSLIVFQLFLVVSTILYWL